MTQSHQTLADQVASKFEELTSTLNRTNELLARQGEEATALRSRVQNLEGGRVDRNQGDQEVRSGGSDRIRRDGGGRTSSRAEGAARRPSARSSNTGNHEGSADASGRLSVRSSIIRSNQEGAMEADLEDPAAPPLGAPRESDIGYISESDFFEKSDVKLKLRKFDGRRKHDWWSWRNEALSIAEMNGFGSAFFREEPVQCMPLNVRQLRAQGISVKDIKKAQRAWCLLLTHITDDNMKKMVFAAGSPSVAWKQLDEWMEPDTPGVELGLFQEFMDVSLSRGGDPLDLYAKLKSIASKMSALIRNNEVSEYIEGRLTNLRFLSALPAEYEQCVERLRTEASGKAFSLKQIQEVVGDR